jgi:hypothetical protein
MGDPHPFYFTKRKFKILHLAPDASASRRFGPAAAAKASSQALQRVSALGERLALFLCLSIIKNAYKRTSCQNSLTDIF